MSKPDLRIYTPEPLDFDLMLPFPATVQHFTYSFPTGAPMNLFDRLEEAMKNAKSRGASEGDLLAAIRKVIHSPLVALLVKASPNQVDDLVLEVLKTLFPLAA